VTAIRHALEEIAAGRVSATREQVSALEVALDFALERYPAAVGEDAARG
jgi:hypothetical protein